MVECSLCMCEVWGAYSEAFVCVAENDLCCAAVSEILHFFRLVFWVVLLCSMVDIDLGYCISNAGGCNMLKSEEFFMFQC
jgi:hypothetical protein